MKSNCILIAVIVTLFFSDSVFGQMSALDNTFGNNGVVTTSVSNKSTSGWAIKTQSDGKILIAGTYGVMNNGDFVIIRYNTNGSIDNSFGNSGISTVTVSNGHDVPWSLDIQSDGKIIVAGTSYISGSNDFAIVRLNTNGSLDNSFDTDGIVTVDFNSSSDDQCYSIGIQSDGKIVAAGWSTTSSVSIVASLRLNTNGSLDTSFDIDGKVTTTFGTNNDYGKALAIQPDGKIIVVGSTYTGGLDSDWFLLRYNTNGSLDNSFDTDGKVVTAFGTDLDDASAIAIQSDGKIIVSGTSRTSPANYDFATARYNTNGSLDNSFDTDGKVTTELGSTRDCAWSISIQSDGKYAVAGTYGNSLSADFAAVRYNINGSLDNTFDSDGIFISTFGNLEDLSASTIQSDGKILITGAFINNGTYTATTIRLKLVFAGLASIENESRELICYPNPVASILTIGNSFANDLTIKIYNSLGQELLNTAFQNKIDFTNYPTGVYSIIVGSTTSIKTKKIIVESTTSH